MSNFQILNITDIRISTTNRKHFNADAMQELADSIKVSGVIQPIVVRHVTPTAEAPEQYEIVAGERRFRASKIAGKTEIPAMVKELSDLDAARLQILENLQREDPHPMEEAEGYESLMQRHGYNADQLAEEVKKSRSYIYGRLKLCALAKDLRSDFLDNKFSASIALLIARIPLPELQLKAAKAVGIGGTSEPMSHRAAKALLQQNYMLDLQYAVFDIKDAKLLAAAGNCVKCPKRTGNQPEIYADVSPNICTNPECHAEKTAAHDFAKVTEANKKGIPVIEGKEADKAAYELLFGYGNSDELSSQTMGYRIANLRQDHCNKRLGEIFANISKPPVTRVLLLANGRTQEAYKKADVISALEAAGLISEEEKEKSRKEDEKAKSKNAEREKEDRECEERAAKENAFRKHLYSNVRATITVNINALADTAPMLDKILTAFFETQKENNGEFEYNEIKTELNTDDSPAGLLTDALIGSHILAHSWSIDDPDDDEGYQNLLTFAKLLGIDPDKAREDFTKPAKRPILTLKKKTEGEAA